VQFVPKRVVANSNNRTGYFGEGSVYGVSGATVSSSASALTLRYNVGANAYAIIGDTYISIGATAADFSINSIDYAYSTATASFNSALF
jgi:hypothetical protein